MAVQAQLAHDQHTVPQWHLRNFANRDGVIWRYKHGVPVKPSRPKGECWEPDFYECEVNGKKTDNYFENWLRRIENDAASVFPSIVRRQELDRRSATIWAAYVASLFARSRKYRMQITTALTTKFRAQTQSVAFVRDVQHEMLKAGELIPAEDIKRRVEQVRASMEVSPSFYHLVGLKKMTASLADALMKKSWDTLQAPPGKFLLTSDCPVMTVEFVDGQARPGPGFAKEQTVILLPISEQHLFLAASPRGIRINHLSDRNLDSINRLTIQFAHKRVYAPVKSAQIQGWVDTEIDTILFGQNAFVPPTQN